VASLFVRTFLTTAPECIRVGEKKLGFDPNARA
jgi:hypothetical protein